MQERLSVPPIRNFAELRYEIRMIRSLGQELSCLNLAPGSPPN
jgi:hypothetical protein